MNYLSKNYYHIKGTPTVDDATNYGGIRENYIKVSLYYERGTDLWMARPRGYYIQFSPIGYGKDGIGYWESYGLFSSIPSKTIQVLTCERKTKKNEKEANTYFDNNVIGILRDLYGEAVETENEVDDF